MAQLVERQSRDRMIEGSIPAKEAIFCFFRKKFISSVLVKSDNGQHN